MIAELWKNVPVLLKRHWQFWLVLPIQAAFKSNPSRGLTFNTTDERRITNENSTEFQEISSKKSSSRPNIFVLNMLPHPVYKRNEQHSRAAQYFYY